MIKYIKIKNVVNYSDIKVDFTSGINLIIGENGVGKSLLFKCIELCLSPSTRSSFKNFELELNIDINNITHVINRSDNSMSIKYNNTEINGKKACAEYLKIITDILFIKPSDHLIFKSSKSIKEPYFNKLLDLSKYDTAYKKINLLLTESKNNQSLLKLQLEKSVSELSYLNDNKNKYNSIVDLINTEKSNINTITNIYNTLNNYLSVNELNYKNHINNSNIRKCSNCGYIDESLILSVEDSFNINTYKETLIKVTEYKYAIDNINKTILQYTKLLDNIDDVLNKISNLEESINKLKDAISQSEVIYNKLEQYKSIFKLMPNDILNKVFSELSNIATSYLNLIISDSVIEITDYEIYYNSKEFNVLSSGESAIISLCIKLAIYDYLIKTSPSIMFIDEITANLDYKNKTEIGEILKYLNKDQVFIISHDDTFNSLANNILRLSLVENKIQISYN